MINIYISNHNDVYTNVAIERYLFQHSNKGITLFLWQNEPCVVFGRNQNVYNEVDIEYADKENIKLVRRYSGGGAVYQDKGNINYTFYCQGEKDIDLINDVILKAFKNIGVNAYFSGRNDLLLDDRKFSGIAYCSDFDRIMYHGTCLVDVSLDKLVKVLKPHDYKLKTHSVSSYKSRVVNLKEIKDVSIDDIKNSFINTLKGIDDINLIETIDLNDDMKCMINKLKDKQYIFENCPSYSYEFDIRLNNANYHFQIQYNNGIIEQLKIFNDDLDIAKKDYYYKALINKQISIESLKTYLNSL